MTTAPIDQMGYSTPSETDYRYGKMREATELRKLAVQQKKSKKGKGCAVSVKTNENAMKVKAAIARCLESDEKKENLPGPRAEKKPMDSPTPNLMNLKDWAPFELNQEQRDNIAIGVSTIEGDEETKHFIVSQWNIRGGHGIMPLGTGEDTMVYIKRVTDRPFPTVEEFQNRKSQLAEEMLGVYIKTCIGMVSRLSKGREGGIRAVRVSVFERICEISFDEMWRNSGQPRLDKILNEEFDVIRRQLLQECQALVFANGKDGVITMGRLEDMVNSDKTSDTEKITSTSSTPSKESNACKKCFRSSERCNEAKLEAKLAQNKAEKYEKKAKRTDELEKKLKEMEQMRQKLSAYSKKDEEIEKLRARIFKKTEIEKVLRAEKNDLKSINHRLEQQVSILKQENEQHRLGAPPVTVDTDWRQKLLEFKQIKDDVSKERRLEEARSMVERLISNSDCAETEDLAMYELNQLEVSTRILMEALQLNIQKIERTHDCSDLILLWELPTLSQGFLEKYRLEIKKKPLEISEDTHCFICFERKREGHRILRCKGCKKEVHEECGIKWVMANPTCAFCRRKMVVQKRSWA
ncbi:hypothetical protein GCK72_012541 [Caenorhabditis remanei]|uniref:RING-type domain-containing protein n=1 Tax=Caenorhabditis remanei TaxID=31234 RepID=A0A6A5GL76_CAERE|nr:hypothetical protein GCK72_012541 [Caenorhabditis remanei]KAF1756088.1 hypothetical protein GCK72_012541 [Caenorhabditis remanei]